MASPCNRFVINETPQHIDYKCGAAYQLVIHLPWLAGIAGVFSVFHS